MKVVFIGSMIPIPTSLIAWNQEKQSPGIIQCKTVTRFQGINPLDPIPSASWYNSSFPVPSASPPRKAMHSHSRPVPRINKENNSENEVSAIAMRPSLPPKKRRSRKRRADRRALERERVGIVHLFKKHAGPISAQQFQQERPSRSLRPATPHQPCGRQCSCLPKL